MWIFPFVPSRRLLRSHPDAILQATAKLIRKILNLARTLLCADLGGGDIPCRNFEAPPPNPAVNNVRNNDESLLNRTHSGRLGSTIRVETPEQEHPAAHMHV